MKLVVRINDREGFSVSDATKHDHACQKIETIVNTVEFRSNILTSSFTNRRGLTNLQIYQLIMNGTETLDGSIDHEIDVSVKQYYKNNKVVGWTTEGSVWTNVNRKFFDGYDDAEVAGNLIHEWLHKLGFDHSSASEHSSVPYQIGYIVRDMIKDLDKGRVFNDLLVAEAGEYPPIVLIRTPVVKCKRSWKTLWLKKVCWYE